MVFLFIKKGALRPLLQFNLNIYYDNLVYLKTISSFESRSNLAGSTLIVVFPLATVTCISPVASVPSKYWIPLIKTSKDLEMISPTTTSVTASPSTVGPFTIFMAKSPATIMSSSISEILVSIDVTSASVEAISAANAASSAETLEYKDVKSASVAAISAAKAASSAEILASDDKKSALVAAISAANASSSCETLKSKEVKSAFVAAI